MQLGSRAAYPPLTPAKTRISARPNRPNRRHPLHEDDKPGDEEYEIVQPDGTALYFHQVPDPTPGKNRLHLCLRPTEGTRDEEVDRLLSLGATLADDHRKPDGAGWAVLADPEGNAFCILRGPGDQV